MSTLVIVESPTKAKTIRNYLPSSYRVEASMGHVRDLPQSASDIPAAVKGEKWAQLGVNVDSEFEPLYIVPTDKKKVVKELKDALKQADELLLATDEDREGESISWHLLQVLQPKVPIKRMVFHEITQEAIQDAIRNCRDVDERLVRAQETRRILDRLVGYTLSPLLWKKIAFGLSAGRVQSVAVRLLVNRERQRRAFRKGAYWDLKASLEATSDRPNGNGSFEAKLVSLNGIKVATGSDFDEATGQIARGRNVVLLNEEEARALHDRIRQSTWTVTNLEERPVTRKPSPPFTTSTLQQEANRKLGLSARDTMRTAQSLYEQGYITYMRTDSVNLSQQAIAAARSCVEAKYGAAYLSPQPRQYSTKSKGAQEAHEAIRPAGSNFRTPQETGLRDREFRLYDLIWKRTVATQMAEARQTNLTVQIQVEDAGFRASGKRIDFPGFFRAYVEGSDDPDAAIEDQEVLLPAVQIGDTPTCRTLEAIDHETQPPARFTEASLVKTLESEGIGRPSTYASIISTITDERKGYANLVGNTLVPTFTAFAVIDLLEKHFPDVVDLSFTSKMEQTLDDIADGEVQWLPYLKQFYRGDSGLENQVKVQDDNIDPKEARTVYFDDLTAKIRISRTGAYIEADTGNINLPKDLPPADLNPEKVETLLKGPSKLGLHPETGEPIYVKLGPYGPYIQLGDKTDDNPKPKNVSLPKGLSMEQVTMEQALGLLQLPRTLGMHPETGRKIQAAIGPYGPYIVHDLGKDPETGKPKKDYRSLKAPDDVITISFERALQLFAEPKAVRGKRGSATPLRELGAHPEDGEPVNIYNGPYGAYVKHGKVNASLPEGQTVETLTMEMAVQALLAKAGGKKATGKKASTKKSTGKATTKAAAKTAEPTEAADSAKATKKTSKTTKTTTKRSTTKTAAKRSSSKSTKASA
jgi:DNA topoisomerase I